MIKIVFSGAAIGTLVPILCWTINVLYKVTFGSWTFWIWPSSIILLGTAGDEHSKTSIAICTIAVLGNSCLYSLLAFLLALLLRAIGVKI